MSYKNLCVHMDYRPRYRSSVNLALELAEHFDAHLTGVFVDPIPLTPELASMAATPMLLGPDYRRPRNSCPRGQIRI